MHAISRFNLLPGRVRAVWWMFAAALLVTMMGAIVKDMGQTMPVSQIAAIRSVFLVAAILPFMLRQSRRVFHPGNMGLLLARSSTLVIVNVVGFWTLTRLPLVYVTAISFSKPLFIALLAVMFLGEAMRLRRTIATLIGFAGVLVMLNPTGVALAQGEILTALAALGVAFTMAVGVILVKQLAASDHPNTIIFYGNLAVLILLTGPAIVFWVPPTSEQWIALVALGLIGLASQSSFIRAYQAADASFVAPFEYIRLLSAAAVGYVIFGESPISGPPWEPC
ncbi:transporter RarD family, DMT superfamily protein [Iodidimonas gelatinilytica]|uniref:Transporter RarD family, DMT superfamily protein n=1 Tax=Iodidimonas gelatinilytica TaxID=1236966 RepID=A0A5A7MWI3_9PROT|nr:DMT family transporter [Iodidimonas gelatinilytica]GER00431.1 transporter RarD family, DMT superfamily protein [Iodidimonas gelatinilytica]